MKTKRPFKYVVWSVIAAMTFVAGAMALLSIRSMQTVRDDFSEMRTRVLAYQDHLQGVKLAMQDARRGEKDMLLRMADPGAFKKARQRNEAGVTVALDAIAKAAASAFDPNDGAAIAAVATSVRRYRDGMASIVGRLESGSFKTPADADAAVGPVAQALRDVEEKVDAGLKSADARLGRELDEVEALMAREQKISAALLGVILVVGIGAGGWLTRAVQRPLQEGVAAVDAIARGDLTRTIRSDRADEFGDLLRAIAAMTDKLRALVRGVSDGVGAVGTASSEIAQGSQDLSGRTEQQASSLQQAAASMEQMAATVKQNADAASQASQLADAASAVAERGGSVFTQVIGRMGEISASSRKIEEIIAVIDGIAFQTNILALNAAVEAARAGEQGRGFAVVAGEVRNLAQRSGQAAREIKMLIADSVTKVESGHRLVNDAGRTMTEIVQQVRRVTDLVGEITSATAEQSSGVGQVNQAVTHLDQMTQQNAALVEQSAAAAQSLKEQAEQLAAAVAMFKLSQDEARAAIDAAQMASQQGPAVGAVAARLAREQLESQP